MATCKKKKPSDAYIKKRVILFPTTWQAEISSIFDGAYHTACSDYDFARHMRKYRDPASYPSKYDDRGSTINFLIGGVAHVEMYK